MTKNRTTGEAKLRVAVVAACVFPSPRGSQVLVRNVVEQLAAMGHEVHLVTYPPNGYEARPNVYLHYGRARSTPKPGTSGGLYWRKALYDLDLWWTLRRVVADRRIDVIHAHNYEAPLLSYLVRREFGTPVVYHSHNALSDELASYFAPGWRRGLAARVGRVLDRQIPRRADFAIALTPELAGFLQECGVAGERLAVVGPAIADARGGAIEPTATRAEGSPGRFQVVYAGNLDPYQDLEVLFDAFVLLRERVPAAKLTLVTHEAQWHSRVGRRVVDWVARDWAEVVVATDYDAVRARMASADALVSPRSSWSGFPIKLVNYAAARRPIVAAVGGAKSLEDGVSALIVANRDAEGMARALERLSADRPLADRLATGAIRSFQSFFDPRLFASQINWIYGRVGALSQVSVGPSARRFRLITRFGERISAVTPDGGAR